jgi:hypothetical protein
VNVTTDDTGRLTLRRAWLRRGKHGKEQIEQIYEWFLDLPVAVVLAVMWLVGAVIEGTCVLGLYLAALVMVRTLVGA